MSTYHIRASSFGGFFDCGYRFEWEQLMKKQRVASLRAHLGTSIHAGTAAFDQAVLDGAPISALDAAAAMMDVFLSPREDVDLRDDKLSLKEAERIALTLLSKYCNQIAPTMNYESVEMPLNPMRIDCGGGTEILLTGTMDRSRVAIFDFGRIIPDVKSGQRLISEGVVSIKARKPQLGIYQLLYEHTTGLPTDGSQIIALQTSSKCEVGVSKVFDARSVVAGTEEDPGLIQMAATAFKAGVFLPNPSSQLCSDKYCGRWSSCKYHE